MLKKIFISIGIMLLSAGAVFGAFYFFVKVQPQENNDQTNTKTILDLSKNYGACTTLDTSDVKKSLGDAAPKLQDPQNLGIVGNKNFGEGVGNITSDSQVCVYAFEAGGTLENGYKGSNALTVERTVYTNDGGPSALIEQAKKDPSSSVVESLGDIAFYSVSINPEGPNATNSYILQVFEGNQSTTYAIRQPSSSASFTDESAKTALVQLATLAKNS